MLQGPCLKRRLMTTDSPPDAPELKPLEVDMLVYPKRRRDRWH